jgi:hypothetical protein
MRSAHNPVASASYGTRAPDGQRPAPVNGGGNTAAGGELGQCAGF